MVVYGANTMSSWSLPMPFCPFSVKVPITVIGIVPKRMVLPMGFSPLVNNFFTTVCPMTQTLL